MKNRKWVKAVAMILGALLFVALLFGLIVVPLLNTLF